ncbi:MAG: pyruvate kinase, partial [Pseudomonadota bacterium]
MSAPVVQANVITQRTASTDHVTATLRTPYDQLTPGATLLINDGAIKLQVLSCDAEHAETEVIVGGVISDRKGVNVPDVVLPIPALTEKDKDDLEFVCGLGVDWLGMSFVQRAEDVAEGKRLAAGRAALIAKIEKP